jgi:hypothetical protein
VLVHPFDLQVGRRTCAVVPARFHLPLTFRAARARRHIAVSAQTGGARVSSHCERRHWVSWDPFLLYEAAFATACIVSFWRGFYFLQVMREVGATVVCVAAKNCSHDTDNRRPMRFSSCAFHSREGNNSIVDRDRPCVHVHWLSDAGSYRQSRFGHRTCSTRLLGQVSAHSQAGWFTSAHTDDFFNDNNMICSSQHAARNLYWGVFGYIKPEEFGRVYGLCALHMPYTGQARSLLAKLAHRHKLCIIRRAWNGLRLSVQCTTSSSYWSC